MARFLTRHPFAVATIVVGLLVAVLPAYLAHRDFVGAFPEQAQDSGWLAAGLFLLVPYVILALRGRRARPAVAYGALAVLIALQAVSGVGAAEDANGALIYIVTWPLQVLVAALAGVRALRPASRTSAEG